MSRGGPRRFDHDEARRLYAEEGLSYAQIGIRLGVSASAVEQVVSGSRYRRDVVARNREYQRRRYRGAGACLDCGAPIWGGAHARRHPRCTDCAAKLAAVTVRDDALRCSECGEWKADTAFPNAKGRRARRYRHSICRACSAAARQRARERRKQPCESCGNPALPPSEKGAAAADRVLCVACYRASDEFRETQRKAVERSAEARQRRGAAA